MVKRTTKLRNEVKDLIKEVTGKTYKQLKDTFSFSITSFYYPHSGNKKTFDWNGSENAIVRYFYENGYEKETAFQFVTSSPT